MKNYFFLIFAIFLFLTGCATAPPIHLQSGAEKVLVAKSDPGDNYEIIGPVSGIDGKGCGIFGYIGSYKRATTNLRNRTLSMGGDYAQLILLTEPTGIGCFNNQYRLRATAYKKVKNAPSPIPIVNAGEENLTKKLRELKSLFDDGILSKAEYETQKSELLEQGF